MKSPIEELTLKVTGNFALACILLFVPIYIISKIHNIAIRKRV